MKPRKRPSAQRCRCPLWVRRHIPTLVLLLVGAGLLLAYAAYIAAVGSPLSSSVSPPKRSLADEGAFFDPYRNYLHRAELYIGEEPDDPDRALPIHPTALDKGPGTGDRHSDSVLAFFAHSYFERLPQRKGLNANPYCKGRVARHYQSLRWQPTDVSEEVKHYLERSVAMAIVTGNFDDYTRVKMARCTWMAHVPQHNLFFVTDSMEQPQDTSAISDDTRELYTYGHWFATEDWKRNVRSPSTPGLRALAELFVNDSIYQRDTVHAERPVAWYDAQLRFYDAFNLMFYHTNARLGSFSALPETRRNFHRWFTVIDDDTYLHLEGLAVVFHFHQLHSLYMHSGDMWWQLLLDDHVRELEVGKATAKTLSESEQELRGLLRTRNGPPMSAKAARALCPTAALALSAAQWREHCASIGERIARQAGTVLHLPDYGVAECVSYPRRMADVARPFVRTYPGGEAEALRLLAAGGDARAVLVRRMARLYSNALTFLGDANADRNNVPPDTHTADPADARYNATRIVGVTTAAQRAVLQRLWADSDALVDPAWVQLYHMPPEKLYKGVRGGAGHHLNARAFYFHFMHSEKLDQARLEAIASAMLDKSIEDARKTGRWSQVEALKGMARGRKKATFFFQTPEVAVAQLSYAYVVPCIYHSVLHDRASDQAMVVCLPRLGITQLEDPTFLEYLALEILRTAPRLSTTASPLLADGAAVMRYDQVPYRCRNRLMPRRCLLLPTEAPWDLFTADNVIQWTTMHIKMELVDPLRVAKTALRLDSMAYGRESGKRDVQHTRLTHFRMKLYYEAIYTPTSVIEEGGGFDEPVPRRPVSYRAAAARLLERVGALHFMLSPLGWTRRLIHEAEEQFKTFLALAGDKETAAP